jgi:DNA-binding NtrC family response regulator
MGRPDLSLSPPAVDALRGYRWPGNTREMRNVLERAAILSRGSVLTAEDLRFTAPLDGAAPAAEGSDLTLEEVERRHVERVLAEEGGHVERAAKRLAVPRSSLYERIKRLGITPKRG